MATLTLTNEEITERLELVNALNAAENRCANSELQLSNEQLQVRLHLLNRLNAAEEKAVENS